MGLKKFKKAFSALSQACNLSPKAENEDILYEIAKCCVIGGEKSALFYMFKPEREKQT